VGASAGGLKAFKAFFRAVPAESKLAYIVVQHLDPTHESKLPELIQAESALPVVRAANGGTPEPGKVYVVPEGRVATIEDGVVRLRRRKAECEQAIDALFSSLAVSPASACGVLLSGYGADGVQGLREIAATGGLTFVQDPSTAEHPEMPAAAIEADAADFVGSPEEIAKRLNEIAVHLGGGAVKPVMPAGESVEEVRAATAILGVVEKETGVDFRHYKPSTVRRRIGRRAVLRDAETLGDYLEMLRADPAEVRALLADLLINVTRFFRDDEVFAALRARVFPDIVKRKTPGEPIRIWVPGCSTGEEVYSLLMTLLEVLDDVEPKPSVTVFGTDLGEAALQRARAGVYAADTCGFVSSERLERFFHQREHGFEIDKSLREMCVFARQDITRDTPFSRLDLVSLRNVLIYMDQHLQRTVLAVAHYALVPDGFLVLGTSETTESDSRLFRTCDKRRHIYERADVPSRLPMEVTGGGRAFEPLPAPLSPAPQGVFDLRAAAEATTLAAFAPPRVVIDANGQIAHFFGDTTPYLGHPEGRATLDAVEMAVPGLTLDLRDAIAEAETSHVVVEREAVFAEEGRERRVAIIVEPLAAPDGRFYTLVAFQELPSPVAEGTPHADVVQLYEAREERLRREVASLRGRARSVSDEKDEANEELRAANEEIQSSNEELQSVNEELETAKEELQSANEELITVNEELRQRNFDLVLTNDDLTNFMTSTGIPVIMLDRELRVRRHTPEAGRVAHIGPSDDGRELAHLRLRVHIPDLEEVVRGVIEHLDVCEREVRDDSGRWYSMEVRPYRTGKDQVDGAVLSFFDIDELKHTLDRVAKRARLSEALSAIDAEIASTMKFDEIMQRALEQGVAALAADAGSIEMRGDGDWEIRYQCGLGGAGEVGLRPSDAEAPIALRAAESRQPVMVADTAAEPEVDVGFVKTRGVRTVLAAPLVVRDTVIGCLLFHRLDIPRPFGRADVDFAARLAASTSLAVENARLFAEELRATQTAESLSKVNQILLSALTPDDVLARLVTEVSKVAGADKCLVVDVRDGTYTVTHVRNVADGLLGVAKDASFYPAFALTAELGRPVLMGDTWNDPRTNKEFVIPYGLHAFQLMPLIVEDAVVGVLAFAYDAPRTFDDQDARFADRMSFAMSLAMRNARLYERERARARLGSALAEIDAAVHSSLDFDEVVRQAMAEGAKALSANTAAVTIHEDNAFRVAYSYGFDSDITGEMLPDELEPHSLIALETRRTVAIEDSATDRRVIPEHMAEYGVGAVLVVPLIVRGEAIGNLFFNYLQPRAFGEAEIEFVTRLGSSMSAAIGNARLFEAEIRTSERLTDVLDNMTDGFVAVDREWRYTLVNPRAEEMMGRPAAELLGRSMEDLFPDMFGWPHYRKVMAERAPETFEVWSKPLERWLETHVYPTAEGLSILFADVSKRKAAEAALAESRASADEMASMLEASSQPFAVGGLDGELLLFNHAFEELTGYTGEELRSLGWATQLTPPEYLEMEAEKLAELVRTGQPVRYEKEYARKDGRRVPIELLVGIRYDERGEPQEYYSFLTDLTERKAAEEALRESAEQFRTLAESIPNLAWWANGDGYITWYNRRWYEYTGTTPEEMEGWGWQSVHDPEFLPMVLERWRASIATGEPFEMEFPLRGADGVFRTFLTRVQPLKDPAGRVIRWFGTNTDISAMKRAEEALRDSESRVRRKLDAILTPEGDIGELELEDLVDAPAVQSMMEDFNAISGIPMAMIDTSGKVIVGVGWQQVCTRFHRANHESCKHCIESDVELTRDVPAGEAKLYRCKNGMWDMASPVFVGGHQVGNVFTGQFFFEDEPVDYDFFRGQAGHYGFDEEAYLAAIDAAPRLSREVVETAMEFLRKLADTLSKLGYSAVQLAHSVSERERNEQRIREHAATMEGIGRILHAALNTATEEELGQTCLDVAQSLTSSAFGFIDEIGPDGLLHDIALSDPGWAQCAMEDKSGHKRLPGCFEIRGLYGKVFAEGKSFFTNTPAEHPDSIGTPNGHPDLTAFLGVPLVGEGGTIGTMALANRPGGYTQNELEILEGVAPVVVEAFERKRAEHASARAKALLDAHIDNSPLAVIEFDNEFRVTRWSDEAEKMFGWKADEVLGKAMGEFRWIYEEDSNLVDAEQRNLLTAANPRSLNVNRNYRKDGKVIWCEWYDSAVHDADGELVSILSQVLEITARKESDEALRASEQRFRLLFANMLDGFAYCQMIYNDAGEPIDFEYLDVNSSFSRLTGLEDVAGKCVTEVIPGIRESNPELLEIYGRVAVGGEPERFETQVEQLGVAFSISVYCPQRGYFVAIFHNITEERERQRFDAALDNIRSAVGGTLDVEEIVHEIATKALETLQVDTVMIARRRGEQWVVTDAHGVRAEVGQSFTDDQLPMARSAVSERRVVWEVDEGSGTSKRRAAMRRLGVRSVLVVPLIAQGRGLGMVGFGRVSDARPFSELETYFATRLVSTATLALDNALAYERERAIADTLQEAVLAPPPTISGIETAYLYRAASAEAAVGGDFYDVFELDGGKVGIVVGDVSGKGLEAARLTSLVRDGIRAYALEKDDPAWVLGRVNSLMYRSSPVESFATLFFGVLDILSGQMRYTAAGHPPAVLCGSSEPRYLEDTPSALVGAFDGAAFTARKVKVGKDDVLVLYTDGVLEARRDGEMYGDARLVEALERLKTTSFALLPQALLDDVLAFTGGSLRDDTVIMCIKRSLDD
jgi:two-component system CheB/CheR fusion protein